MSRGRLEQVARLISLRAAVKGVASVLVGLAAALLLLEAGLRLGSGLLSWRQARQRLGPGPATDGFRILAIGESTTAPVGGHEWPRQLERLLNERHPRKGVMVINEGRGATNTGIIAKRLPSWLELYRPDLVISMMGLNDPAWYGLPDSQRPEGPSRVLADLRIARVARYAYHELWRKGRPPEAPVNCRRIHDVALSMLPRCESKLKAALERFPKVARWHLELGSLQSRLKRHTDAEASFKRAVLHDPDLMEAHVALGELASKRGDRENAALFFGTAARLGGGTWESFGRLARVYDALGEDGRAEAAWRFVLELDPGSPEAEVGLMGVEVRGGRDAEALARYRRIQKWLGERPQYLQPVGELLTVLRKPALAEQLFRAGTADRPSWQGGQRYLGDALMAQGRWEEAQARYRRAAELDPYDADSLERLALAYAASGKRRQEEGVRRRLIRLRPRSRETELRLLEAELQRGEWARAEARCRSLERWLPAQPEGLESLSDILLRAGQPGLAEPFLKRAVAAHRAWTTGHRLLGEIFAGRARWAEAEASYREALGQYPDDLPSLRGLASVYESTGRSLEAERAWAKVLELFPRSAEAELALLALELRSGRREAAEARYLRLRRWLAFQPGYFERLSRLWGEEGRLDHSQEVLRAGLKEDPAWQTGYRRLADTLAAQARWDQAAQLYRKAAELDPLDGAAGEGYARTCELAGRRAEAEEAWRRAQRPPSVRLEPELALLRSELRDERWTEAEERYRRLRRLVPPRTRYLQSLGEALRDGRRLALAEQVFRDAVRENPRWQPGYRQLARTLAERRLWDEAQAQFSKAIELDPYDVASHAGLAAAYGFSGRLEAAEAAWRRVLALQPRSIDAELALVELALRRGGFAEAEARFRRIASRLPTEPSRYERLSGAFQARRRLGPAEEILREGLRKLPDWQRGRLLLAAVLAGQARWTGAIAEYRRAVELDPYDVAARASLAAAYDGSGRRREAERAWHDVLALQPRSADAELGLIQLALDDGREADADARFERLKAWLPASHRRYGDLLGRLWQRRELDGIEALIQKRLELDPRWQEGYRALGALYAQQGRLREASHSYRRLAKLASGDLELYRGLAELHQMQGREEDAERTLARLLEVNSRDALGFAYDALAQRAYRRQGRAELEEAEKACRLLLSRFHWSPESCLAPIQIYVTSGRSRAAVPMCHAALKRNPYWAPGYACLANAMIDGGRLKQAIGFLRVAVDLRGLHDGAFDSSAPLLQAAVERALPRIDELPEDLVAELVGFRSARPGDPAGLTMTSLNYRRIADLLRREGIPLVALQYPTNDVEALKRSLPPTKGIFYVENKENFARALATGKYEDLFVDRMGGAWGHCTDKGNRLIAENLMASLAAAGILEPLALKGGPKRATLSLK